MRRRQRKKNLKKRFGEELWPVNLCWSKTHRRRKPWERRCRDAEFISERWAELREHMHKIMLVLNAPPEIIHMESFTDEEADENRREYLDSLSD